MIWIILIISSFTLFYITLQKVATGIRERKESINQSINQLIDKTDIQTDCCMCRDFTLRHVLPIEVRSDRSSRLDFRVWGQILGML